MSTQQYGLVGYPLSHSFSGKWFAEKFSREQIDAIYTLIPLEDKNALYDWFRTNQLQGFNVTIPYKESILHLLDKIDPEAQKVGAVNCVVRQDQTFIGYNTDIIGFEMSLMKWDLPEKIQALVFGSGGASKAVQYVLNKKQIPFQLVTRNEIEGSITYADLDEKILNSHPLLIQTTPLGTFPDVDSFIPIPFQFVGEAHFVFDMVYNPEKSAFLERCESRGATIQNGWFMLEQQAIASWRLFQTSK
ncbi:MAG: shikimate dehydrogenase family protein [Chitinophagaceae bacterium]